MGSWYSRRPGRLALQAISDALCALCCLLAALAGRRTSAALHALAAPGDDAAARLREAAEQVQRSADDAQRLPVVGRGLADPLGTLSGALSELAGSGQAQVSQLHQLATWAGWIVALVPIALAVSVWLPPRLRFVRDAAQVARLRDAEGGDALLALRALTSQPLHRLRLAHPDPARAWRADDPQAVAALADLQLRELGVSPRGAR